MTELIVAWVVLVSTSSWLQTLDKYTSSVVELVPSPVNGGGDGQGGMQLMDIK